MSNATVLMGEQRRITPGLARRSVPHRRLVVVARLIGRRLQPPSKWESLNVPLGKGPGGRKREGVKSVWVINNVHITQIIEIIPSKAAPKGAPGGKRHMDVMLLRYVVENKDTKAHSVGIRNT